MTWDTATATVKVGPFDRTGTPKRGFCVTCDWSLWSAWNHVCSNPDHDVRVEQTVHLLSCAVDPSIPRERWCLCGS